MHLVLMPGYNLEKEKIMLNLLLIVILLIPAKYILDLYMAHRRRLRIWRHIPLSMRLNYNQRDVK